MTRGSANLIQGPAAWWSSTGRPTVSTSDDVAALYDVDVQMALEVRTALKEAFRRSEIPGIGDVRLLRSGRGDTRRLKVFVILATHDVGRDLHIVQLMNQFGDLDYDLVPDSAVRMVPDVAESVL